jgi:hypothetical protein
MMEERREDIMKLIRLDRPANRSRRTSLWSSSSAGPSNGLGTALSDMLNRPFKRDT